MSVTSKEFGCSRDGRELKLYTITGKNGLTASVTNLGAILVSLMVPDAQGNTEDVVLGFDKADAREKSIMEKRKGTVTIKDISRKCGVSVSTVSKALNHYGDIAPETAELIRQTAREMHYVPNTAARQLKTNTSHNIGVLFVDEMNSGLAHEYFYPIFLKTAIFDLPDHFTLRTEYE